MPTLTKSLPQYRKHKASGQAIVTLNGKDFYLGPHGTKASKVEYDRLIGEWLENGRNLPASKREITVVELIARFWDFARKHYVKNGKLTDEIACIKAALKPLKELYGRTTVSEFGPLSLKAVRQRFVERHNSRCYINKNVGRIKRMFKWGVENELVPPSVYQGLAAVAGLRKGKTNAPDHDPVEPVADDVIEKILPHLRRMVADMVRLQRLTGCRPGELCIMRGCDIDRSRDVWRYWPESHKTEHLDKERVILIGPKAQVILSHYLLRAGDGPCFRTRGKPDAHLSERGYREAVHRACVNAEIEPWNPNQLRHSAGTEIRRRFGLEGAQVVLGHARADVTQIYAERDLEKAEAVMREVG